MVQQIKWGGGCEQGSFSTSNFSIFCDPNALKINLTLMGPGGGLIPWTDLV